MLFRHDARLIHHVHQGSKLQPLGGLAGALGELVEDALEARAAEHAQEQLERRIGLGDLDPEPRLVLAQKARQVRRRRVRRVQLRHRRRDQEEAHSPHQGSALV